MMKALILAAGDGDRLRCHTGGRPKPLIRILGIPLIVRTILSAKEAGIGEFVIVIGYKGEEIRAYLGDGSNLGVDIEYVFNPEWLMENGISALAAKENLRKEGAFLLLMADHILGMGLLQRILERGVQDGCVLCVDRNMGSIYDLDDATKVKTLDGRIVAIGKDIEEYDAVDCGVFLCTPMLFGALEDAISGGDDSLTAGIAILARQGKMGVVDISGSPWMDIDTEPELKMADGMLLQPVK